MNPISYYQGQFRTDLEKVATGFDSISVVSLKGRKPGGYRKKSSVAFHSIEEKCLFLFSYFFCVLLDQAVHSTTSEEHSHFERLWQCPKFRGILGTAHTNLHPGLILEAAVWQIRKEEEESRTPELTTLAEFFSSEFREILIDLYPKEIGRLPSPDDRIVFCEAVFRAISEGLALVGVPGALEGMAEDAP